MLKIISMLTVLCLCLALRTVAYQSGTRIDSVVIRGNEITRDFIIRREVPFQKGDCLMPKDLRYAEERVYSLGIFNFVNASIESDSVRTNLIIKVEEAWRIYPIPFAKIEGTDIKRSTFGLDFTWKNFRGLNQTLGAKIFLGYDPKIILDYSNPSLMAQKGLILLYNFTFKNAENKNPAAEEASGIFKNKICSSELGLGKRLGLFSSFSLAGGILSTRVPGECKLSDYTSSGRNTDFFPTVRADYTYDSRDIKQFATRGRYFAFEYKYNGFGADGANYSIFTGDIREYLSVSQSLVTKISGTFRSSIGDKIPLYDLSYLGGDQYVRGWKDHIHQGRSLLILNLEAAYPLFSEYDLRLDLPVLPGSLTRARIKTYLSLFADCGGAFDSMGGINTKRLDSSLGLGFYCLILPHDNIFIQYALNDRKKGELIFGTGFSF